MQPAQISEKATEAENYLESQFEFLENSTALSVTFL